MHNLTTRETVAIQSILLLDDDTDLIEILEAALQTRDYVVTSVHDGVEGLKQAMEFDFDVIICDLMMPTMPGDMFYRALHRIKPHLCERFIFITGHKGVPTVDKFLAGTKGLVLYKPVSMRDLFEAIENVLQKSAV